MSFKLRCRPMVVKAERIYIFRQSATNRFLQLSGVADNPESYILPYFGRHDVCFSFFTEDTGLVTNRRNYSGRLSTARPARAI